MISFFLTILVSRSSNYCHACPLHYESLDRIDPKQPRKEEQKKRKGGGGILSYVLGFRVQLPGMFSFSRLILFFPCLSLGSLTCYQPVIRPGQG